MAHVWAILTGAAIGIAVAAFANKVVLPYVLRLQRESMSDFRMPITGWTQQNISRHTVLIYRYLMPVFFPLVFALCGYYASGGTWGAH